MVILVMSISPNDGIGKDNKLLYNDPEDMKLFRDNTKYGVVMMGRNTWESLPVKPLKHRINIVVTSDIPKNTLAYEDTLFVTVGEADTIVKMAKYIFKDQDLYVIGGSKLVDRYKDYIDYMYISAFIEDREADTFLPKLKIDDFNLVYEEKFTNFVYKEYERIDSKYNQKIVETCLKIQNN